MSQPVTLTLTRLTEPDNLVHEVLSDLFAQTGVCGEILFIEQSESEAIQEREFSSDRWNFRIIRRRLDGLSAARNLSVVEAENDLVLFCDADALATPEWAARLTEVLSQRDVAIAGSRILPNWRGQRPLLTASRVVLDQYSLFDLGEETTAPGSALTGPKCRMKWSLMKISDDEMGGFLAVKKVTSAVVYQRPEVT